MAMEKDSWEENVLCKYIPPGKKTSFFKAKPKDEYRDSVCKVQRRNNDVLTFNVFKVKPGNVLKPLLDTIISDRNEIERQENDGYAEITLKQIPGAVIRFLSFDSRDRCISFMFQYQRLDSSQFGKIATSTSITIGHDIGTDSENDVTSNEKHSTVASHKPKSSLIALTYAHKSFNSDEDEGTGGIQDSLIDLIESRNSETNEFDDTSSATSNIITRASEKRPSATENKSIAMEEDEFSIGESATTRLIHLDQQLDARPDDFLNYSPTSEEDRMMSSDIHVRDIYEIADVNQAIASKLTNRHEVPVTIPTRKETNQSSGTGKLSQFGSVDLPEPQSLELLSSTSVHAQLHSATQNTSDPHSKENFDTKTNIIVEEVQASNLASYHNHGMSSMAPESSLVGLLVGTDKPIRKSNLREQQAVRVIDSSNLSNPVSNTTSSTPVRLGNSGSVATSVELPTSEYNLAHSHHHASLRGAALTTHDLKSPLQLESQQTSELPMRSSPGMRGHGEDISRLLHVEQEQKKQPGTLRLSDIATRRSAEFVLAPLSGTQPTIGVLSPQDQQQLVYLQREIEQLVRMNDHLNAALERSELMRQEDAMEYEHRIGQLQSALEEMTLLSSTQQDPTHSAHLLGEDSATQLMSMKSDLDDTEEVHYDTLEKSLGTKRSMQEHGNHEMQELISMLSVQLHQQKEETTTLQQEKAALRQAIEELSAEFLRLDDEKAQIVIEKEQLNHDKEALELSLAHFSAQATASQQLHEKELFQQSVENELRLLRGQLELSQSFEEHSKTTILRLERLVQEQQQLIKDMSTRLHHGGEVDQHAVQQIQMQLLSLQEENMKLNLAREQIEVENQRLHNQLELQRKEMTFKLQDTEEQTHNKDSRLHESQIQIESLQQDLNQVQAENGILSQRIQLFKDQEFKMSRDIELLNHRLQMEQSSLSTQVTSYRQSMDASQHSYDDLLGKYHHLDDEHRRVVREKQQQVTDLEESLSVQRNTVQDLSTRNTLLTEKNDELLEQLQQEKAGKKKYKEQIHQLEIQTNQERKSMLQKIQELQSKVDQQTQWLHQNEMQLKQSEETRLHLQDTLTQSIQTQSERYQSLQLLHDQSTRDLEVSQEERRKEQRAYDDSIRGLQRTIDSLKASQVQLERQLASSESEHAQWQQSCVLKSQDQEVQLKATSDRVQDLLREIHDLNLRFQQEERQNTIHRQSLDTIRNKASAFAQVYQLSLASDPQEDIVPYVQEIFTWFSRSFDELQEGLQLLGNQHAEQEDYWKRRIASLEETVLQTSASWRESQQKLEQTDKNYLERASELQSMQLILQKKDFTIQELNLQIDASRRDYQHVLDQQSQVEKQLVEEKQKLKSLENSLKLLKEKEVSAQDEIQQLRQQLSQAESGKSIVEEQLQALQRLHAQLEAQERDNETKSLQQLKELGQERIKTMDAVRQVDQLQRKKDILEQELAERNSYWENRWSDFSSKVSEEEKKLKESQAILERELRQAQERNSETDDKLRQCERELHRTTSDLRLLQQELEGMASKVVLERVQKNFSDLEIEYAEEKAKWRDSVQKLQDTHEQLEVDLLQHQRLVHQLHEVAAAPLQFSNSSTQRDSHSHNRLSSSQMQLVQTNESTDWRQVSTTLVERLQDLVQQEKLLTAFSDIWLESLKAAETVALENEGSFAYLQGLRTLIQHLHPLPPSMLVSNTGERFKELQERCNVQLLQPLLHEYEQIRQNYVETNYISSTQSQDLEKAKAQVQNLDQQLSTLRQQSAQQQDSYREKISRLEQEQQHAHLEQERQHSLHLAEIAQLNQNWELKLQQLDQHFQRQQEAAVRQVQATAESERLVLQQKNDISHTAIVHDMQDLQNQIRIKDNMNRALEESLAEKLEMLRTRSEDIEQWEERYRQQRAQCGSLQTELDNIKRTLSAKEDRQHEMAATNRRLELDIVSIQEKLRTRSEQVRVLAEQVQVLEVEVAEESVAKERLERRLERQMLKDPSSIRRSVGESHTMTVGHAVNPAKSSTLSSSTPATFAAAGTTSAIQNLVQRRKNSGQFSTHKTAVSHSALDVSGGSSKELLVNAGDRLDDDSENRKRDFSMINDPTSKLARLRNKIASSQHGQSRSGGNNTPSRKLVASSAEFENSSISSAPPLRLQDLLHN